MSYHPFWLRVGISVVFRDASKTSSRERLSEERIWKRSVQGLVRDVLLLDSDMRAAPDKGVFWVSGTH